MSTMDRSAMPPLNGPQHLQGPGPVGSVAQPLPIQQRNHPTSNLSENFLGVTGQK